jgi:hypothetical protein
MGLFLHHLTPMIAQPRPFVPSAQPSSTVKKAAQNAASSQHAQINLIRMVKSLDKLDPTMDEGSNMIRRRDWEVSNLTSAKIAGTDEIDCTVRSCTSRYPETVKRGIIQYIPYPLGSGQYPQKRRNAFQRPINSHYTIHIPTSINSTPSSHTDIAFIVPRTRLSLFRPEIAISPNNPRSARKDSS